MTANKEMSCWEIMQCEDTEDCPARQNPKMPCWEVASEMDDYRRAFNICKDCIVYLLKSGNSVLSQQEMNTIIEKRIDCVLA